jgi:hypothetical protein
LFVMQGDASNAVMQYDAWEAGVEADFRALPP